jgi:hypothetical protein
MGDGNILHAGALRIRVTGEGSLQLALLGYDDIRTFDAVPLVMKTANAYEMTRLVNFISPEIRVKGFTSVKGERFRINRITVFVKPIYSELPA